MSANGSVNIIGTIPVPIANLPATYPLPASQVTDLRLVTVDNLPSEYPLPAAQVVDLKAVTVGNLPSEYPLPAAQVVDLKAVTDATVTGSWGYRSGVSGTPVIPADQRILQISASAPADTDASMTINGGNTVLIPAGKNITFIPRGNLVTPTLVFTDTDSYIVEFVG